MPKIYVKTQYGSQDGYNTTNELYKAEGFNYGIRTDRVGLVRFNHVPIPSGSTINSAFLHIVWSVKNNDQNYAFTVRPWYDGTGKSAVLSTTRNEWVSGTRSWVDPAGNTSQTYTWIPNQPLARQLASINVKPLVDASIASANWTLGGAAFSVLLSFSAVTSPDNQFIHRREDAWVPMLEIDYTAPASDGKTTVVNVQENATVLATFPQGGAPAGLESSAPYGFNNWFGAFVQPAYAVSPAFGTITAPKGGSVVRVTAPNTGNFRSMIGLGNPALEDGEWYNHSCYVYVPTGSPDVQMTPLGDRPERLSTPGIMTTKDSWQRVEYSFIANGNSGILPIIQQVGTYASGTVFYVANVQLTKGRQMRPYIDGSQVLTNADYGWAGPTGSNGFVRAVAPTVTLDFIPDQGRRKSFPLTWTYASTAGHGQTQSEIQVRRTAN